MKGDEMAMYKITSLWTVYDPGNDEFHRVYVEQGVYNGVNHWMEEVENDCKKGRWMHSEETFIPSQSIHRVHLSAIVEYDGSL